MRLLQHLSEDDPDRQVEFCKWIVNKSDGDVNSPSEILFTDGEVNCQTVRYWSDSNLHCLSLSKMQGAGRLMVWCGIEFLSN
jgi:hypothetical protein